MSDLEHRAGQARSAVTGHWSDERAALVGQRVQRRLRQRERAWRALRLGAAGVALVAAGAATLALWPRVEPASPAPRELRFSDGSTATALDALTELVALADAPEQITVRLERGAARFDVTRRPERSFRVEAPPVVVQVVGTRFVVERLAEHVRVGVERGHVRVLTPTGEVSLTDGQSGLFPLAAPPAAAPPVPPALPAAPAAAPAPKASPDWRSAARQGEFERAWALLRREPAAGLDDPPDLLLASDVARLSGHPLEAKGYLERLLERHPHDARAPLATFTLGRVLLDELGWPRDAAAAFAGARALDGAGPLAEDALAREVEAWARAGDADRARAAARSYLQLYPTGQRLKSVRRLGGLE